MISKDELLELMADTESDRVERTISIDDTNKFGEAICAFSNDMANHKKLGYLLIGVHDKSGELSGLKATDRLLKNIAAIRSDGNVLPQPAMTVHKITLDKGDVIVVEVTPAHFPPVRYKGDTVNFDDLSEIEKKIYAIIKENQGIKSADIVDLMDKSPRTIEHYLKNLKEIGFVEYVGSAKTGGYQIYEGNKK